MIQFLNGNMGRKENFLHIELWLWLFFTPIYVYTYLYKNQLENNGISKTRLFVSLTDFHIVIGVIEHDRAKRIDYTLDMYVRKMTSDRGPFP